MTVIVVAGIPGSGKTTLAEQLSAAMAVPLLSKDVIKEALMDVLGSGDLAWTQELSRASHHVMYEVTKQVPGAVVLEAHFYRGVAEPALTALGRPLVQVYCRCPVDVAWDRYRRRRDDPDRHPGHRPDHQDEAATEAWRTAEPQPLDLDAPLVEVDTSREIDVDAVVAAIDAVQ